MFLHSLVLKITKARLFYVFQMSDDIEKIYNPKIMKRIEKALKESKLKIKLGSDIQVRIIIVPLFNWLLHDLILFTLFLVIAGTSGFDEH